MIPEYQRTAEIVCACGVADSSTTALLQHAQTPICPIISSHWASVALDRGTRCFSIKVTKWAYTILRVLMSMAAIICSMGIQVEHAFAFALDKFVWDSD